MNLIKTNESQILGGWIFRDNCVIEDDASKRINYLKDNHLIKIATSESGWETLYQDPSDNRYWELKYLDSEWQGGGAPSLFNITLEEVVKKYGNVQN